MRSFTTKLNSVGLSTVPWGTPILVSRGVRFIKEVVLCNKVIMAFASYLFYNLVFKMEAIWSLCTVSNAAAKSRKNAKVFVLFLLGIL